MKLYQDNRVSLEEFFQIREKSEEYLEYIDGLVYMSPSPSVQHQRISGNLFVKFRSLLNGGNCEVFHAPMDVELSKNNLDGAKVVIPDISIICDKSGFTESKYVGVPNLIVEILSPSNQTHDLITKLNLYMIYGVKEYWIVNPMLKSVTVYALNEDELYVQHDMKTETGIITSKVYPEWRIDLDEILGASH